MQQIIRLLQAVSAYGGIFVLKPQDILIVLKIISMRQREWKYSSAAYELHMSPSEVHAGVKRLRRCSLLTELRMGAGGAEQKIFLPDMEGIREFMRFGIRHVFPGVFGEPALGLPTSFGVEHLFEGFDAEDRYIPVWEYPGGDYRGISMKPLYGAVPKACIDDFFLYELLALTDAVRSDDRRLREFAWDKLNLMLGAD